MEKREAVCQGLSGDKPFGQEHLKRPDMVEPIRDRTVTVPICISHISHDSTQQHHIDFSRRNPTHVRIQR